MSKFADRSNQALLVIDVQKDVVPDAWQRDEVIANINTLIAKARDSKTPVIWIQHCEPEMEIGSAGWEIVPELRPLPGEPIIQKRYRSSFEDTELDETLANLSVGHLYICGAESNNCVRHTSHAGLERGYDVTLVGDAHTTSDIKRSSGTLFAKDIVAEQNRSFYKYELPGRSASLAATAEISF
jgi:nicotinamidase-related amidase